MEVEFFDSLEEANERLQQAMKAADARVRPWQAAILPGDYFIADGGEVDLLVFGEVLEGYTEERLLHYRFCRCHSVACPEGELGDVHVSTVLRVISREQFEAARGVGWVPQMDGGNPPFHPTCARGPVQARCPAAPWFSYAAITPGSPPELAHSAFRPTAAGEHAKRQMARSGKWRWR